MSGASVKPRRQLARELTEIMAGVLHYQEKGEPDWATMSYQDVLRAPEAAATRYRNEPHFHAQVDRAVAMVLQVVP